MTPSVSPRDVADWGNRAGFTLPESALVPLAAYLDLLMQWNKVMNLVGTRSAEETFFTLVVDSLHLARFLTEKVALAAAPSCWDLGSGAGLPGLPLRMLWTEGEYWLVESREKRALFLSTALARHPLSGTRVYRRGDAGRAPWTGKGPVFRGIPPANIRLPSTAYARADRAGPRPSPSPSRKARQREPPFR